MDSLRADEVDRARNLSPDEKARLALTMMEEGIALKRIALRHRHPHLDDAAIEELLRRWLRRED